MLQIAGLLLGTIMAMYAVSASSARNSDLTMKYSSSHWLLYFVFGTILFALSIVKFIVDLI